MMRSETETSGFGRFEPGFPGRHYYPSPRDTASARRSPALVVRAAVWLGAALALHVVLNVIGW